MQVRILSAVPTFLRQEAFLDVNQVVEGKLMLPLDGSESLNPSNILGC